MRPRAVALGLWVVAVAAAACSGSNNACFRSCPALEGQWEVAFEPAADPAECQKVGATVQDGVLEISRQTSRLSATFAGEELSGTAYDTGDFTLDGQATPPGGGLDAFSFRGALAASPDGGADAGRLSGLYDATLQRPSAQGTVTCRLVRSYSAARR